MKKKGARVNRDILFVVFGNKNAIEVVKLEISGFISYTAWLYSKSKNSEHVEELVMTGSTPEDIYQQLLDLKKTIETALDKLKDFM